MSVDTMRFIDYYVGVPLCFLMSLWVGVADFFHSLFKGRKAHLAKPRRVLFLQLSEMGSAIIGDSSLRWTRAQGADIYFAIFKRNVASLRLVGTVPESNLFLIREDKLPLFVWDAFRFLLWTRKNRIDTVIDFELFSRFSSLLTAASGCAKRVGFHKFHAEGLYRGSILTHKVAYNPHIHIAKNFMALVKSAFAEREDIPYFKGEIKDSEIHPLKLKISPEAVERVKSVLSQHAPQPERMKWVIMNCAGGEFLPQRRWPQSSYVKLAHLILDNDPSAMILLTGSPMEKAEVDPIRAEAQRDRLINFAGAIRFEDLPALYTLSRVMISNDSGPAHFASLTDIPTYVFFGPETPKLYGALGNFFPLYSNLACSPCVSAFNHRKTPCTDNRCLQVISAESVYQKVLRHLA
jgi:ADP-heptose:LPS heptosyltransferase